jgi:hypothetical protein
MSNRTYSRLLAADAPVSLFLMVLLATYANAFNQVSSARTNFLPVQQEAESVDGNAKYAQANKADLPITRVQPASGERSWLRDAVHPLDLDVTQPPLLPKEIMGAASPAARRPGFVFREEHRVIVNGVEERWGLYWVGSSKPACSPDQPEWKTCPCSGFAFGERGDLVLVRERPRSKEEHLGLAPFFEGEFDGPGYPGEAVLRRWDVEKDDLNVSNSVGLARYIGSRPLATVMHFGDYDHDGHATEFLLQVGTLPCGKPVSVAVGVSRRIDRPHVFSTVEHPDRPLVLQTAHWVSLLKAKAPVKVVDWVCGDHASETETVLELSADADGIHGMRSEYECHENGRRAGLIKKDSL